MDKKGVLLLDMVLMVEENSSVSHKDKGWEKFTNAVIKILNKKKTGVVFILLGNAREKKFITNKKHLIIETAHLSTFSCNSVFLVVNPFQK